MSAESLYQAVIGADYTRLAPAVRRFHALQGRHVLHGWVDADPPASMAARVLAWCLGTPRAARSGPLRFELDATPTLEIWTRHFPGQTMVSRLSPGPRRVVERLGPTRLTFRLAGDAAGLGMQLERIHVLGVPCPRWLMPRVVAQESGDAARLHFHVQAFMPLAGRVASYRGYLELPVEAGP